MIRSPQDDGRIVQSKIGGLAEAHSIHGDYDKSTEGSEMEAQGSTVEQNGISIQYDHRS